MSPESERLKRYQQALANAGITLPQGELQNVQCKFAGSDWYALVDGAWYWWDPRERIWKSAPLHTG